MSKDIEELRSLVLKSKNVAIQCELIKTVPLFQENGKSIKLYDKNSQIKLNNLIKEIALKCVDLVELQQDIIENDLKSIVHKRKPNVKSYAITTDNMQDALKQLEELDLPEEVKELARECLKN